MPLSGWLREWHVSIQQDYADAADRASRIELRCRQQKGGLCRRIVDVLSDLQPGDPEPEELRQAKAAIRARALASQQSLRRPSADTAPEGGGEDDIRWTNTSCTARAPPSWWPVWRWNLAYKNPAYLVASTAYAYLRLVNMTKPITEGGLARKKKDLLVTVCAKWDIDPASLQRVGDNLHDEIVAEATAELKAFEHRMTDSLLDNSLEARQQIRASAWCGSWVPPFTDTSMLMQLDLSFLPAWASKEEHAANTSLTIRDMVLRIQCGWRCCLARRSFGKRHREWEDAHEGEARRALLYNKALVRSATWAQARIRGNIGRRRAARRREAASCLSKLITYCRSSAFTDSFAGFLDEHARSFRDANLACEQEQSSPYPLPPYYAPSPYAKEPS